MVLRSCLVLLFARRAEIGTSFSRVAGSKTGLCAESATAGHRFLDSGIVLRAFAWKPLAGFELSGFSASNRYERRRFLLANPQGKPAESQGS
jgi:hypothetical protein